MTTPDNSADVLAPCPSPWRCDRCGVSPVRDCLDGEALCQRCCDAWARAEGVSARDQAKDDDLDGFIFAWFNARYPDEMARCLTDHSEDAAQGQKP